MSGQHGQAHHGLVADTEVLQVRPDRRGLDRPQRQALLVKAREHWADATLIFISHDVAETQAFDRVLVLEQGRIVEDAPPAQLLTQASRYRAMLGAERVVREDLWADAKWRRLWLEDGELKEHSRTDGSPDNKG